MLLSVVTLLTFRNVSGAFDLKRAIIVLMLCKVLIALINATVPIVRKQVGLIFLMAGNATV